MTDDVSTVKLPAESVIAQQNAPGWPTVTQRPPTGTALVASVTLPKSPVVAPLGGDGGVFGGSVGLGEGDGEGEGDGLGVGEGGAGDGVGGGVGTGVGRGVGCGVVTTATVGSAVADAAGPAVLCRVRSGAVARCRNRPH